MTAQVDTVPVVLQRGLPKAYCPSCGRALDVVDEIPMRELGMCAWCKECTAPRRDQEGEPKALHVRDRVELAYPAWTMSLAACRGSEADRERFYGEAAIPAGFKEGK